MVINIGHPEGHDELERVLAATAGAAFAHVARWPMKDTSTLLIASEDAAPSAQRLHDAEARLPGDLAPLAAAAALGLAPGLRGGAVYTDDRAPVEWLIDKSIVEFAADPQEDG
jgi:hypothetical protein